MRWAAALIGAAALAMPGAGAAAPGSPFPLRHQTCTLNGPPCERLPKTWTKPGPGGKSGGTNAIESIDLSYHHTFKAGVAVTGTPAGVPKQCAMKWSQHLDVGGGPDLGFYPQGQTQTVQTSPPGWPTNNTPLLEFYGNVTKQLTDAKLLESWYGTGATSFANIVDLYPSQSADKLPCAWGYVDSRTIEGSVTINYRAVVLYAPLGPVRPPGKPSLRPH